MVGRLGRFVNFILSTHSGQPYMRRTWRPIAVNGQTKSLVLSTARGASPSTRCRRFHRHPVLRKAEDRGFSAPPHADREYPGRGWGGPRNRAACAVFISIEAVTSPTDPGVNARNPLRAGRD
jgi:hypothetical protein